MKLERKAIEHLFIRLIGKDAALRCTGGMNEDVAATEAVAAGSGGRIAAFERAQVGRMPGSRRANGICR